MPINSFLYPGAKVTTGFEVANSCRFDGSSAYMHKTPGGAGDLNDWTVSVWVKRSKLSVQQQIFAAYADSNNYFDCFFEGDDTLNFRQTTSGSAVFQKRTAQKFRDVSAWYNLVFSTTGSTQKIWVNGVEVTSWEVNTGGSPSTTWNAAEKMTIGVIHSSSLADYFSGYMAEFVSIDGSALAATSFGEFDSDSPRIWKPKDVSGLTFGTNGFYLDFEDSSNLGNDANGGTDLTEVNLAATDQCLDSPTNNFAVPNILLQGTDITFSENNLQIAIGTTGQYGTQSSIGMTAGKWYCELKYTATTSAGNDRVMPGIVGNPVHLSKQGAATSTEGYVGSSQDTTSYGYYYDGNLYHNSSTTSYGDTWTLNDIIGIYLDCDNNKLYFSKNGTVQNSGTGISITDPASTVAGAYFFAFTDTSSYGGTVQVNFGGASCFSISSAVSDANGYGSFEYSPSGTFDSSSKNFLALCTKNLGSDGG